MASLLQGIIMSLMMPSRQAMIAEIVGEEQLVNAVALNNLGMNVLRLLAPALTGFLIDAVGFQAIYFTMTAMYLMAVGFITSMPHTGTMTIRGIGILTGLKSGLQYVRRETHILIILIFILFAAMLSMPYMFLLPIFANDILKVGASGMGVLISVSGIGAMISSIAIASLPSKKRGSVMLASTILVGLSLVGFSFSSYWYLSLALMFFVGLGQATRMTLGNTMLQQYASDEYRGRVMSIYMMDYGLTSTGVFFTGLLAEVIGVQWAVGGLAMVLALGAMLALGFAPRIRKLD